MVQAGQGDPDQVAMIAVVLGNMAGQILAENLEGRLFSHVYKHCHAVGIGSLE